MSEHNQREETRRRFIEGMSLGEPRALRAHRFANLVQAMLQDFLPTDRDCCRSIDDRLHRIAYEGNYEIVNVPPELDALDKLALERNMLDKTIQRAAPDRPMTQAMAEDLTKRAT